MEYENRRINPTKIIIFIVLGGFLVILADLFVFGGVNKIIVNNSNDNSFEIAMLKKQHNSYMNDGVYIDPMMVSKPVLPPHINDKSDNQEEIFVAGITIDEILANKKALELAQITPALGVETEIKQGFSRELDNADKLFDAVITKTITYNEPNGGGKIAIIIDDMGISLRSKLVEVLPAPLTLSYLPYAKNLSNSTARASQNGHELMVHVPMEPMNTSLDTGPKVLSLNLSDKEFTEVLDWALSRFDGFVGINNHMGSKATKDKKSMTRLMSYLKEKQANKLFFIDSKTIGSSVAASTAREAGVPYATRDVFLDHEISKEFIAGALKKLERIAHKKGHAIAIAHPHKETIIALKAWLPTLKSKGLTLVPASALIKYPKPANDNLVAEL